jgi:hypothetical protein
MKATGHLRKPCRSFMQGLARAEAFGSREIALMVVLLVIARA